MIDFVLPSRKITLHVVHKIYIMLNLTQAPYKHKVSVVMKTICLTYAKNFVS